MPDEQLHMDGNNFVDRAKRLYSMDYARGIAVLLVATGHFFDLHPFAYESLNVIRRSISFSGLTLFFVLSGFLLTRQMTFYKDKYAKVSRVTLWSMFFFNRILRIYPAYLVSLFVVGIINGNSLFDFFVHTMNIHNLFSQYIGSINPIYWTLAVEFQWYLVFPLIFVLFTRMGNFSSALLLLGSLLVSGFLWRQRVIFRFLNGDIDWTQAWFLGHGQLIAHMFAFCSGVLLFFIFAERYKKDIIGSGFRTLSTGILLCLAGGFLTVWGMKSPSTMYGVHLNAGTLFFLPLGASFLLHWMVQNEQKFYGPGKYVKAFIRWIGVISYSLYLWHYPVITRLRDSSGIAMLDFVISFSVAIAVSWISYFFVERYFMGFKGLFLSRLSAN
jgi:peptidoglycan/LPS O-acetylase OafA/YrhL